MEGKILDYAGVLNTKQKQNIFHLISSLERESGSQIAIITIDSLMGESIHSFSLRKANELRSDKNNADDRILITVVVQNKEINIHTGEGLNAIVKEEVARRIIREDMAPRFRKNRYGSGIFVAVSKMKKLIKDNKESTGQLIPVCDSSNNKEAIAIR